MYDLSIVLPAIRPHYWVSLYDSFVKACTKYTFEVIFVSPYDLPGPLKGKDNIKHIKSYATSCRAAMEGTLICEGRFIAVPADDGVAFPDSFDKSIDLLELLDNKNVVILRYREGKDMKGKTMPADYWSVQGHSLLLELGIPKNFLLFMQPLMYIDYFKEIGGWDCRFEHLAFAAHDLSYRIQRDGGILHHSPVEVMNCEWLSAKDKNSDHHPIHESHNQHDLPLFREIYKDAGAGRIKIDFDNWKNSPAVWARRWPRGIPK